MLDGHPVGQLGPPFAHRREHRPEHVLPGPGYRVGRQVVAHQASARRAVEVQGGGREQVGHRVRLGRQVETVLDGGEDDPRRPPRWAGPGRRAAARRAAARRPGGCSGGDRPATTGWRPARSGAARPAMSPCSTRSAAPPRRWRVRPGGSPLIAGMASILDRPRCGADAGWRKLGPKLDNRWSGVSTLLRRCARARPPGPAPKGCAGPQRGTPGRQRMRVWVDAPPRTPPLTANAEEAFAHPALFYQGPWEYLSETVPFIREGLAADEPVAVAVPRPAPRAAARGARRPRRRRPTAGHDRRGTQPGPDHRRGAARGRRRPPRQARADHRGTDLARPIRPGVPGVRPARGADQPGVRGPLGRRSCAPTTSRASTPR